MQFIIIQCSPSPVVRRLGTCQGSYQTIASYFLSKLCMDISYASYRSYVHIAMVTLFQLAIYRIRQPQQVAIAIYSCMLRILFLQDALGHIKQTVIDIDNTCTHNLLNIRIAAYIDSIFSVPMHALINTHKTMILYIYC